MKQGGVCPKPEEFFLNGSDTAVMALTNRQSSRSSAGEWQSRYYLILFASLIAIAEIFTGGDTSNDNMFFNWMNMFLPFSSENCH
ncbi:MAG: hypothetical protein GX423_08660 [Nitrospiraceae bacterium]|jgi:hypothetical protein|nr:hypothetical protein [Nitrospiraceae bacterium]